MVVAATAGGGMPANVAPQLAGRVREVATALLESLRPIVATVVGPSPRPSTLARGLKIDATLAGRIVRALRSRNVVDVIHEIPSPEGLRIVLAATSRHEIDHHVRSRAADAIREYELLLADLPGGRATLDTIAADWSPATRERAENSSRQSIFKSMSNLLGVLADAAFETVFIQPSEDDPDWLDTVYVVGKLGMRRLRSGGPITAFGRANVTNSENVRSRMGVPLTLLGRHSDEPLDYLLEGFSSHPLPSLKTVRRASLDLILLPPAVPTINTPVSLVFAQLIRHSGLRPRRPGDDPFVESHIPRIPSRDLVFDAMVREDTFQTTPDLSAALHGIAPGSVLPDSPDFRRDEVAVTVKLEHLRAGLSGVEVPEIPGYTELIDAVFRAVGWDRSAFAGYRCRMRYPVPLVEIAYSFPAGFSVGRNFGDKASEAK